MLNLLKLIKNIRNDRFKYLFIQQKYKNFGLEVKKIS